MLSVEKSLISGQVQGTQGSRRDGTGSATNGRRSHFVSSWSMRGLLGLHIPTVRHPLPSLRPTPTVHAFPSQRIAYEVTHLYQDKTDQPDMGF
jgi:hypothetical protein